MSFPPIPVYPLAIDSDKTLFLVYNTSETQLTANNPPWSQEVAILPVAADKDEIWPNSGFANISGELFYFDNVSFDENGKVNTLLRCGRNLGGQKTQFNAAGTWVRGFVVAEHDNQLVQAILNIETFIGVNGDSNPDSLDNKIRALDALPTCADDLQCPDVTLAFNVATPSTDACSGTTVNYNLLINGSFTSFNIDFGDGNSSTSQSGTHTYAPNSTIDPVVTVSNNTCQVVQTAIQRTSSQEPKVNVTPTGFNIDVPPAPDFPQIVIPNLQVPETTLTLPPITFPFQLGLTPFGPIDINIPSIIIVEPPIPSIIMFSPVDFPSTIIFLDAPSFSPIDFGPAPSFSPIRFGPAPSFSPIRFGPAPSFSPIRFGPAPTFSPIRFGPAPSFSPISFGPAPTFSPIRFGPAPSFSPIAFGPAPTFSPVQFGPAPTFSPIRFGPAPTISVNYGPAPTISLSFGPLTIAFGPAPSFSPIKFGPAPSFSPIKFGPAPTVSPVKFGPAPTLSPIKFGPAPTISVNYGPAPTISLSFGPRPTMSVVFGPAPSFSPIKFGPTPSISPISFGPTPVFSAIKFGPAPTVSVVFGPAPTVSVNWGPTPTVSFGPTPVFSAIKFGPAPTLSVSFGPVPTLSASVIWGPTPTISFGPVPALGPIAFGPAPALGPIAFGPAPAPTVNWGPTPTISVTWGPTPACSCTVTVTCPGAGMMATAPVDSGFLNDQFVDPFVNIELDSQSLGIPSEITLVVPTIPDISLVHNLPTSISFEVPKIDDIKIIGPSKPIPSEIKVWMEKEIPTSIRVISELPSTIFFDTSSLPTALKLEIPNKFPTIMVDASGIPTIIQVVGLPDSIELKHNLPSEIILKAPEDLEIPLVYKGGPIPVQFDFRTPTGTDGGEAPCFALVPCGR